MTTETIIWALHRLSFFQGTNIDNLALNAVATQFSKLSGQPEHLFKVAVELQLEVPRLFSKPDEAFLPILILDPIQGWGVITHRLPDANWSVEFEKHIHSLDTKALDRGKLFHVTCHRVNGEHKGGGFEQHIKYAFREYRNVILEASIASLFISLLAMATSLFSMQVYDRVIPTRSEQTLIVLAVGVGISIFLEVVMKIARSRIMDDVVSGLDARLSRQIFERLLSLRVDQIPASVGSLAAQIRGYEHIRSFYTSSTLFVLVDLPLGLLFLSVLASIGHFWLALVVVVAALIALILGGLSKFRINEFAGKGAQLANLKTGLLVEAVEGAETIKAGSGGWKFLQRWINVNAGSIKNDLETRSISEALNYASNTLQQVSYAALVIVGALMVMQGNMTMGALIACSILSGRVLSPVLMIPNLLVQHSHVKAAKEGLERLYMLKTDNYGVDRPIVPQSIRGRYELGDLKYCYSNGQLAVDIPQLVIEPGEKVAIIGPIGAGKSTLLKLFAGLNHASSGRVCIDGIDIGQISRSVLSSQIGYLHQEHRLFQGTLRENILIGIPDPGDDYLARAMARTGMDSFVRSNPKGLEAVISEGGKGLSGGQRQLLAFTRLIVCNPSIMILDEPTASMDEQQERRCLNVLTQEAQTGKTIIVVTHKPALLPLFDRVIAMVGNRIVIDGPREKVSQEMNRVKGNASPFPSIVPVNSNTLAEKSGASIV